MADLRIDINTSGVVRSEKTVDKVFKKIIRNSNKLNNSILLVEKAINKQTKAFPGNTRVLNTNTGAVKKNTKARKSLISTLTKQIAVGNLAASAIQKSLNLLSEAPRVLKEYSDAWLRVNNIIRLGVETEQELIKSRQQVIDIAIATRTPLTDQVKLFNRLTLSQRELGASTEQILGVIKGVGQALGVTATSTLEARGSLIQLAQAFGQPIVRAEEFNSILEGIPRVAKALADGFGLTRAQLRKLVLEGKVTNKEFFQAFQTQLPLLEREFGRVQPTIDSAITVFSTGFGTLIGQFNELTGLASKVASGIENVGKAVKSLGDSLGEVNDEAAKDPLSKQIELITQKLKLLNNTEEVFLKAREKRERRQKDSLLRTFGGARTPVSPTRAIPLAQLPQAGPTVSELEDRLSILRRAKASQGLIKAAELREKRRLDELKDIKTAEAQKLDIIKKTFRATGIISEEGKNLLIRDINKERDAAIKVGLDKVVAAEAAAVKIAAINTKILNKEQSRLKELQKQNRDRLSEEIRAASQIKDLNLDRLESVRKNTDKINKEIAQRNKKFHDDELKRILVIANAAKDLNLARLEGLKDLIITPEAPITELDKYIDGLQEATSAATILENATISAFKSMEDTLVNFVTTGKLGFEDLAKTAIAELARIFIRSQIIKPLAGAFGNAFNLTSASAKGNIASGGVSSLSNSIVSSPTIVPNTSITPFASGGALMGERGPEGILPLARTSSGKLGVETTGGTPDVEINIHGVSGDPQVKRSRSDNGGERIDIFLDNAMAQVIGGGGKTDSVLKQKFNLTPQLAGR